MRAWTWSSPCCGASTWEVRPGCRWRSCAPRSRPAGTSTCRPTSRAATTCCGSPTGNRPSGAAPRSRRPFADRWRRAPPCNRKFVVRSLEELRDVVSGNPSLDRSTDPTHHHVVFLAEEASLGGVDPSEYAAEDAVAVGPEVYLYLPGGIGRSKLAATLSRGATATGRPE